MIGCQFSNNVNSKESCKHTVFLALLAYKFAQNISDMLIPTYGIIIFIMIVTFFN